MYRLGVVVGLFWFLLLHFLWFTFLTFLLLTGNSKKNKG